VVSVLALLINYGCVGLSSTRDSCSQIAGENLDEDTRDGSYMENLLDYRALQKYKLFRQGFSNTVHHLTHSLPSYYPPRLPQLLRCESSPSSLSPYLNCRRSSQCSPFSASTSTTTSLVSSFASFSLGLPHSYLTCLVQVVTLLNIDLDTDQLS
jgi:hypothetical protein